MSFAFQPAHRGQEILRELARWNGDSSDQSDADNAITEADRTAKYSKMVCSPFVFFRGTNHLFWRDFANHPELKQFSGDRTHIWIQGDLHAENFGSFHNDEGHIVYDLNDFDEAAIADYQYDVWRMAISIVLVARERQKFDRDDQAAFVDSFCRSYLETIAQWATDKEELALEFTEKNTYGKLDDFLEDVKKNESRKKMLKKWTNLDNGDRYYDLSSSKLAPISEALRTEILQQMPEYGKTLTGELAYCPQYFHVKDIAHRRLAGTGSLGTPRFYIVIEGEGNHHKYDCILDVKRQGKPTPYHYLGKKFQRAYDRQFENDAQRQAIAYKALVKNTDDHLGWMKIGGEYYSVRERSPYKEAFPLDTLTKKKRFRKLAEQWGKILATSHSRADQDAQGSRINHDFDEALCHLTNGKFAAFSQLVQKVALSYADQVELDYEAFRTANPTLKCLD